VTQTHDFTEDGDGYCLTCRLPKDNLRHGAWQQYTVRWSQVETYEATILAHNPAEALAKHLRDHLQDGHWLEPVSTEWSDPTITENL
jgi:hypothetical protein